MDDKRRFGAAATEAANRAEATALLIRSGYRVYRPEADIEGEDLLIRDPRTETYCGVQLKAGAVVDIKYFKKNLFLLFPDRSGDDIRWFLIPHDDLFAWMKDRHGHTPGWRDRWVYTRTTKYLREFMDQHEVRPIVEEKHLN
jgi:hypothetical protein